MDRLASTDAVAALRLPMALPGCRLRAMPQDRITALAPYPGQGAALSARLGEFPEAGEVLNMGSLRLVWAGRDLAFAFGTGLPDGLGADCALTDQSDGWCGFGLHGAGAANVLGRKLPFDLRAMPAPASARSLLDHIPVLVIRQSEEEFELWVWRSMVQSTLHALVPA